MKALTVILVVLVILALAAAIFVTVQNRRRTELRRRFGPEYDRALGEAPSRREAEQHLAAVVDRRSELDIRDLDDAERARYAAAWDAVQAQFVDQPGQAVDSAEALISTVMRDRGYPTDDFDDQADLISADHPDVVSHYREAHAAHERHRTAGGVDTEDLRQSFVHYRDLFTVLTDARDAPAAADAAALPAADDRPVHPAEDAAAAPVDSADPDASTDQTTFPQETR